VGLAVGTGRANGSMAKVQHILVDKRMQEDGEKVVKKNEEKRPNKKRGKRGGGRGVKTKEEKKTHLYQ
jgi:hypothetical protein